MANSKFPNVTNPHVSVVTIFPLFTADFETQAKAIEAVRKVWETTRSPDGLIAGTVFKSTGGESIFFYLQWSNSTHVRRMTRVEPILTDQLEIEPFGNPNSPIFKLYKSMESEYSQGDPDNLICAFFDTDGSERQHYMCDRLIALGKELPEIPGAVSSHFHMSLDGTRIINFSEWRDVGSHDSLSQDGVFDKIYEASTMTPGVRSLRGNSYTLGFSRVF